MIFCIALYKYTLRAWFRADDFAWLGLGLNVETAQDLLHALFAPMAQGTIRPLSERAFFMTFFSLFELNALPYRILVLATQLASIYLLSRIAHRLTRSYWAALAAPILWTANVALARPMTWTAAYNEVLCSFFLLLSFDALLSYIATGKPGYNLLQWVSFLLALGSLELAIVYPALAILYVVLFAPKFLRQVAWMLLPSVALGVLHSLIKSTINNHAYDSHVDWSMIGTFFQYWNFALGPAAVAVHLALTAALLAFILIETRRGNRLPLFGAGWFLIALMPFLPIRDHVTDYYLTIPMIGLSILGGSAIGAKGGLTRKLLTYASLAAYLVCSIPATRANSRQMWAESMPIKRLVLGVQQVEALHPGKTILLAGVDEPTFWNGVYDRPFRLLDSDKVYVTPDTVHRLPAYPELGNIADYALPQAETIAALKKNDAVVYSVEDGRLKDITQLYQDTTLQKALPKRIELGHPPLDSLIGNSWYGSEGDFRWMPKQATVRLGAPEGGKGTLRIEATCAPVQIPLMVSVAIGGTRLSSVSVPSCDQIDRLKFALAVDPNQKELDVTISVDHTVRVPPDPRDLGLAVKAVEVTPN